MAQLAATHAVGESIATFLRNTYPEPLRSDHPFSFTLATSDDLSNDDPFDADTVSIFLYRIAVDQYLHPGGTSIRRNESPRALPLDLHYMVSAWTANDFAEHTVMTWVMAQLHWHPVLDRSNLSASGGWAPADTVQVTPSNISQEDLTRIWDVLAPNYRLSTTYVARVVHIDPPDGQDHRPVVAKRFSYEEMEA